MHVYHAVMHVYHAVMHVYHAVMHVMHVYHVYLVACMCTGALYTRVCARV